MTNEDALELRYIPLDAVRQWERNPKAHDLGGIIASIARHGFNDPPKWDANLNGGEGGLAHGNGRAEALHTMKIRKMPAPRGVVVTDQGDWLVPVYFGLDQVSQAVAEAYALDHNNLTMIGGGFTAAAVAEMWHPREYATLAADLLGRHGVRPVTVEPAEVRSLAREIIEDHGGRYEKPAGPDLEDEDEEPAAASPRTTARAATDAEDFEEPIKPPKDPVTIDQVRINVGSLVLHIDGQEFRVWNEKVSMANDYEPEAIKADLLDRLGFTEASAKVAANE